MNWHPMSEPPTEAGQYWFWDAFLQESHSWWRQPNSLWTSTKHGDYGADDDDPWGNPGYTHWARVTAPGEDDREYTALAVMNEAGEFLDWEQAAFTSQGIAFAMLYEDTDYCDEMTKEEFKGAYVPQAEMDAFEHGARVVRVRARVEEV